MQHPYEKLSLFRLVGQINRLFDQFNSGGGRRDLHLDRVAQQAVGQLFDFPGHRRGKKHRLTLLRQSGDHLADIVDKAHIEHPVGLIEDKNFNRFEMNISLIDQVVEPAGGGDEKIDAAFQFICLRILRNSAEDNRTAQGQIFPIGDKIFVNLQCQLPGRRQNQGTDRAPAGLLSGRVQPLEDRQRESRRLAGSRLGAAKQVPAFEGGRNGPLLNRRRLGIALCGKCFKNRGN